MKVTLVKHGTNGAPEGSENWDTFEANPGSTIGLNMQGKGRCYSWWTARSVFNLLPGTAAGGTAGKDDLTYSIGTGTEVIARATKGGINVKTQATTPADNDNAMIIPTTSCSLFAPLRAGCKPIFTTRVNLTQITELVFGAGFDENVTSPVSAATAGDGAGFQFDPSNENVTGITTYATNFILTQKVAGADTYQDSGIAVNAGVDYNLGVEYDVDLKPHWYINGVEVGTAGAVGTADAVLGVVVGVQINAGSPAGQKDFDCRFVSVGRSVGA